MKGRKPKEDRLKLLAGNPGKRPLSSGDGSVGTGEAFIKGELEKPDYLDEYESKEWDRIVTTGALVLSEADAGMVLVACSAFSDLMIARKALEEAGSRTYETESQSGAVMIRQRPEVAMMQNARTAYHRALAELGLSPVSHTRVKALPDKRQTELPGIARLLG